jgi:hypothetical protein
VLWAPDVLALNNEPALVRMSSSSDGVSLTITVVPQIAADGIVQMSVSHALQETRGERVAEADTVMRVADGTTAVIAGLTSPAAAGANGTELVVLVRPTVVVPGTRP